MSRAVTTIDGTAAITAIGLRHHRGCRKVCLDRRLEWAERSLIARRLARPVSRLGPNFLRLRTRLAGEMTRKFATYRIGLAIVGDISGAVAASDALRDLVCESNRGTQVWFVADETAFRQRVEDAAQV